MMRYQLRYVRDEDDHTGSAWRIARAPAAIPGGVVLPHHRPRAVVAVRRAPALG
ncbi:hypothetical protein ACFQS1_26875 [Paractinoplanes rhizophilus]|uniref:Uncharacterized protein n=1 Tax=Paractinoplanes rhizophilus TaxID=1416877 RepID=A0ABW2HWR2_9ACTN|nr:hypothetical protein [Actinoplanes sp.]